MHMRIHETQVIFFKNLKKIIYKNFFKFFEETLCQIQCNYKNRVKNENRRTFEIASFLIFTYDKIQRAGK